MKIYSLVGTILFNLSLPAQADDLRTCSASANDKDIIAGIVHAFYEAERTGDSEGWRRLTTSDFAMFHEGVIEPPGAFERWIGREHTSLLKDKASSWTLDISDLAVRIDCTTAFTTQKLHNVAEAPTLKPGQRYDETFLESFWLRKLPRLGWRIAFWNAEKMPKETPGWAQVK